MAADSRACDLLLVRRSDGFELSLQPLQGLWTEAQYLALTNQTNHLIEFADGELMFLPLPTSRHQSILLRLYELLNAAAQPGDGIVLVAPLRLHLKPGRYRMPDVLLLLQKNDPRKQDAAWLGANLVVEVVSPEWPERDTEEKPHVYAEAGVPEYWIVNPLDETVTVLTLDGESYGTHGVFGRGEHAASVLLTGFSVSVDDVLDAR